MSSKIGDKLASNASATRKLAKGKAKYNVITLNGKKVQYPTNLGGNMPRPGVGMASANGKRITVLPVSSYPTIANATRRSVRG
jgi:hypothetical protein